MRSMSRRIRCADAMPQRHVTAKEECRGFESLTGIIVMKQVLHQVHGKEYSIVTRPTTSWRDAGPSEMVGLSE